MTFHSILVIWSMQFHTTSQDVSSDLSHNWLLVHGLFLGWNPQGSSCGPFCKVLFLTSSIEWLYTIRSLLMSIVNPERNAQYWFLLEVKMNSVLTPPCNHVQVCWPESNTLSDGSQEDAPHTPDTRFYMTLAKLHQRMYGWSTWYPSFFWNCWDVCVYPVNNLDLSRHNSLSVKCGFCQGPF